ncbi:MAG: CRISPR/Cas system-associated exonuclease Cas4 (RecB family) [Gammaproteobacteria bacterium]|jgi:CRISPR/Cas system-associated exonuclease Cas4 (RecB family)
MPEYISKSKYRTGLTCPRKLWLLLWRPELQAQPSGMTQLIMEQGSLFGKLAQQLYAGELLIEIDLHNLAKAAADTHTAIEAGSGTILEATFQTDQYRVLSDVVQRLADGSWHLIEVKSATKVKRAHIPNLAFQRYVIEQCGYRVSKCSVLHANTAGHLPDIASLFTSVDVTEKVTAYLPSVASDLKPMAALLDKAADIPVMQFKKVCVGCDFQAHCWAGIERPTIYNAIDSRNIPTMEAQGIFYVDDIPADAELPGAIHTMVERMQQRRIDINPEPIKKMLGDLRYPLYFLDFESVATATPLLDDSSPWQKYAFQYSLHVQTANGEVNHIEFLHDQRTDPSKDIANSLLAHIGSIGSVIVYNKTMERGVLKALARQFPEMGDALRQISSRIWDLEQVFKKHYRHWRWGTKSSIKNVLPTLVPELSYKDLEVQEGGMASLEWLRMIETDDAKQKAVMANALKRYCELDTLAMVRLLAVVKRELESEST